MQRIGGGGLKTSPPRSSFSPDTSAVRILWDGIKVWLKAEITTALAPAGQAAPVMMPKEILAEA